MGGWHGRRQLLNLSEKMPSPLWDRKGVILENTQFLFWWDLSPMRQRPGAVFFESCAEMLSQLEVLDHQAVSLEMQRAYAGYVSHNRRVVSAAVGKVLPAA